ncbi:MAG: hypothetical protein KF883_01840 [Thermomicrobiales bacterium]|nr:hypothetical protein [Thermomicrobiales bacterium]
MSEQTIDRLARAVAMRGSRRRLLAGALGGAGAALITRLPVGAQPCQLDNQCSGDFTCQGGFCEAPGCTASGNTCSSNNDCCSELLCVNGVCGVGSRCGREDELCGNGCCPGLTCAAGYCAADTPAPPENNGGGGSGNGGAGGGGSNGGGSGAGGSGGGSGTTTGGVAVASLPSTGAGTPAPSGIPAALIALAGAAGFASIASRGRSRPESTGPASQDS